MSARATALLGLTLVAALATGCSRVADLPTGAIAPAASSPAPAVATPTLVPSVEPSAAPQSACGDRSQQAVVEDMVSAPTTLPLTRVQFAASWNERSGDARNAYRLNDWVSLGGSGSFQSYTAGIPEVATEDQVWAIDNSAGPMSSIALMMFPNQATVSQPILTGRFLQTMLSVFSQSPGLLRELGVALPLDGYGTLEGVNACASFSYGADFRVRLVQVSDGNRPIILYVRSATAVEAKDPAPSGSRGSATVYAYPALGQDTWAAFAPPLPSIPDVLGTAQGWITPIPSSVIRMTRRSWSAPFIATITPVPGGGTIYRRRNMDGAPEYVDANPFAASDVASGVDPLVFVGNDSTLHDLPAGARLMTLLGYIVNTPTGEGLFYVDGQRIACSWTGGTIKAPKLGLDRASVKPICVEEP